MDRLCIVADDSSNLNSIRAQLRDVFDLRFYAPDQLYEITPDQNVAFDINLIECTLLANRRLMFCCESFQPKTGLDKHQKNEEPRSNIDAC